MDMNKVPPPASPRLGREICGDLAQAERREWWLANGRGAYAAGTLAGTQTRCYHGLLVAPRAYAHAHAQERNDGQDTCCNCGSLNEPVRRGPCTARRP